MALLVCWYHYNFWWTYRCLDKYIRRCSQLFIPKIWLFSSSSSLIESEDANHPLLVLLWIWRRTDQWYKSRLKTHQNYRWMVIPSTISMLDIPRCSYGHNKLLQCQISILKLAVNLDRCLRFKFPKSRHSKKTPKEECFPPMVVRIRNKEIPDCMIVNFLCACRSMGIVRAPPVKVEGFQELMGGDASSKHDADENRLMSPSSK